jgi:hypothetical protein
VNLSVENLMLISKFAKKARTHIGLVKVKEVFTNPSYASKVFIKAGLSDNQELAQLTKEICSALNVNMTAIGASERYINAFKEGGINNDSVWECKQFLIKFSHNLYKLSVDGVSYRQAVEAFILNVETSEREFCINLAREFYPFWLAENRLTAETNMVDTLALDTPRSESTNTTLLDLWGSIEQEFFSDLERRQLNLYVESLEKIGILVVHIKTRQKIAKIIIKELRKYNNPVESYRKAIDKTLYLFTRKDLKEFFLTVSREFYCFLALGTKA